MCGIHLGGKAQGSLDELTNSLLAAYANSLSQGDGLASRVIHRNKVLLKSGELASDVTVDLIPGGRSRRLLAITSSGDILIVDCETYVEQWQKYQNFFDQILKSFRVEVPR